MTPVEICLIIVAVVMLIGSYFVSEKLSSKEINEMKKLSSKELQRIMEKDLNEVEAKVKDILDNYVEDSVQSASRPLEKMTNEQIMAINEYSDTVIKEINKNHNEVMFLYSMLNDKQVEIKNMSLVIEKSKQHIKQMLKELAEVSGRQEKASEEINTKTNEVKKVNESAIIDKTNSMQKNTTAVEAAPTSKTPNNVIKSNDNYKEQILKLYNEGKSVIEIGKELNIGLGEVKLVIDLFKGDK